MARAFDGNRRTFVGRSCPWQQSRVGQLQLPAFLTCLEVEMESPDRPWKTALFRYCQLHVSFLLVVLRYNVASRGMWMFVSKFFDWRYETPGWIARACPPLFLCTFVFACSSFPELLPVATPTAARNRRTEYGASTDRSSSISSPKGHLSQVKQHRPCLIKQAMHAIVLTTRSHVQKGFVRTKTQVQKSICSDLVTTDDGSDPGRVGTWPLPFSWWPP